MRPRASSVIRLSLLWLCFALPETSAAAGEKEPAFDAIAARLERLDAIDVRFRMHEEYNVRPDLAKSPATKLPDNRTLVIRTKPRNLEQRFIYFDGSARYESRPASDALRQDANDPFREPALEVWALFADREEQLIIPADGKPARGAIRNRTAVASSVIDVALGLRQEYEGMWLTAEVLRKMQSRAADGGTVVLERVDDKGRTHQWTFGTALGYALTKYQVLVTADKWVNVEIECAQFKNVNGLMLPFSITKRILSPRDGKLTAGSLTVLTVDQYEVGVPAGGVDALRIVWPAGATVGDARTKAVFKIDKPRRLDDDAIAKELRERDEKRAKDVQQTQRRMNEILSRSPATAPAGGGK